jgi:hypothetical protein
MNSEDTASGQTLWTCLVPPTLKTRKHMSLSMVSFLDLVHWFCCHHHSQVPEISNSITKKNAVLKNLSFVFTGPQLN